MLSKINKFFSSVKLAIFLLIAIAVLSMIGTFINQGDTVAQYKTIFGPETFKILYWLGFLDIYDSWYFVGLALLLMVNLVVASINSIPFAFKAIFGPYPSFQNSFDKKTPKAIYELIKSKKKQGEIIPVLNNILGKPFREVAAEGGATELYYSKNSIFRISPYIAHISVLVILTGVLLNAKYGFRSFTNIKVGETTNISYLQKNNKPVNLPFYIRLDKYETKYYKDGIPKSYISKLTIVNNKHISVLTKDILVNHPLTYDGITIYQASYGHYKPTAVRFLVIDLNHKKFRRFIELAPGELFNGNKISKLSGLSFKLIPVNNPGKNQMPFYLDVYKNKKTGEIFIQKVIFNIVQFKNNAGRMPLIFAKYKNIAFLYNGIRTYYYSGVEITKNSYTAIIWVGSIMLVISLFFSFFFNHREIWVRILPETNGSGSIVEMLAVPKKKFESFYKMINNKIKEIKNSIQ